MESSRVGTILQTNHKFYRDNSKLTTNTSIELPDQIQNLITGTDYWREAKQNRYKKLIREGHLNDLLQLAELAAAKRAPANWFAKVASKVEWERTLKFLATLHKVAQNAAEVVKRVKGASQHMAAVYKACWRHGESVIIKAITAQETGRDQYKYFCWLTRKVQQC